MSPFLSTIIGAVALLQFSIAPLAPHPLHVSTTEINYNNKEKSLEITCRIFTDDFEAVLAKNYNEKIDLSNPKFQKAMDLLVAKYLNAHLQYKVDNKSTAPKYIGYEVDKEAVNIYFEIAGVGTVQTLAITNSILYDRFDDQMNILHAQKTGVRKSVKASFPQREMLVRF